MINHVEDWGRRWGFRFSVEKTEIKLFFFTRRHFVENVQLTLDGKILENVYSRLIWKHIMRINEKLKKVLNVMRCIAGI